MRFGLKTNCYVGKDHALVAQELVNRMLLKIFDSFYSFFIQKLSQINCLIFFN